MDLYKMSFDEIRKESKEFNKTGYGMHAARFARLSIVFGTVCSLILILIITIGEIVEVIFEESYFVEVSTIYEVLILGLIISIGFFCVTQMQYGKMLKEYIETKKSSKNKRNSLQVKI